MGTITLPNNPGLIQNAQITDATKVMENFNAIVSEVNGSLSAANLAALAVETAKIAALAVTAAKIATDAVETAKIKDVNVTAAKLATDAVETAKIKDVNVTAAKLATDAVETAKIKDINVTTAKIANENVTLAKIVRSTLDTYLKAQGAADPIFEKLALRDTGIFIGTGTRNASGMVEHAGIGFQPSVVIFFACDDTGANMNWSVGFDNVVGKLCIKYYDTGTLVNLQSDYSIYIKRPGNNYINGRITGLIADGFEYTWTLLGACVCDYTYLCLP